MSEQGFERVVEDLFWLPENDGQAYHVTPGDRGGATVMGVTWRNFYAWRTQHNLPATDAAFRVVSRGELLDILHTWFWIPARGDQLPVGPDAIMFEIAAGSGPGWAAALLRRAFALKDAFRIDDATLHLALSLDPIELINRLTEEHETYIAGVEAVQPGAHKFGAGWDRRVAEDKRIATAWAEQAAAASAVA